MAFRKFRTDTAFNLNSLHVKRVVRTLYLLVDEVGEDVCVHVGLVDDDRRPRPRGRLRFPAALSDLKRTRLFASFWTQAGSKS